MFYSDKSLHPEKKNVFPELIQQLWDYRTQLEETQKQQIWEPLAIRPLLSTSTENHLSWNSALFLQNVFCYQSLEVWKQVIHQEMVPTSIFQRWLTNDNFRFFFECHQGNLNQQKEQKLMALLDQVSRRQCKVPFRTFTMYDTTQYLMDVSEIQGVAPEKLQQCKRIMNRWNDDQHQMDLHRKWRRRSLWIGWGLMFILAGFMFYERSLAHFTEAVSR